jgi:MFS family permease
MDERPDVPSPEERSAWREALRNLAIDISPLREHRDFRLLWLATALSSTGSHITSVALAFQVYEITGSPLAVGLLGVTELIPLLTLPILGGAIADNTDRRKIILATELVGAACAGSLALNSLTDGPALWLIYVLAAGNASVYALGSPAQRSATPLLVRNDQYTAAAAINGMYHNLSAIVGPTIGGVLIAVIGLGGAYLLDTLTFVGGVLLIAAMRPLPPAEPGEKLSLASIFDGVRFLRGRRVLQGSFIVDLNAMIFGMPQALFPAFAETLGAGPSVLGAMYAAPSLGALCASLTSGWTSRVRRQGVAVYVAVIAWGGTLTVFGASNVLWLSLVALVLAGAADMISAIFRTAILQASAPQHMLGRLHGVELAVVAGGPSLGDLEAGALASLTSVRFSTVFGGLGCIVGVAAMAVFLPEFARYDSEHPTP